MKNENHFTTDRKGISEACSLRLEADLPDGYWN